MFDRQPEPAGMSPQPYLIAMDVTAFDEIDIIQNDKFSRHRHQLEIPHIGQEVGLHDSELHS
jgi:hypothetical protein